MKIFTALMGILMMCLMVAAASAAGSTPQVTQTISTNSGSGTSTASSSTTVSAEQALSQVYVSSVTVDPQEFYPYEHGTITVQVTNSGSTSVAFENADILDNNIYIEDEIHNPYQSMTYLGPGTTMTYTFQVVAKPPEGTYYPLFTVASRDAGTLHYPIMVQIDSKPIQETISQRPDYFALENTDNVNLTITNPRVGAISNVIITPSGSGVGISPLQTFIVSIPGGSSVNVPFAITPHQAGTVNFSIQYSNGQNIQNPHSDTVVLPLNIGKSKTAASTVINDLALTESNGGYQLTGDVTNTGITDANGVVVSVGAPAHPVEPYSSYAIGSLTSNDFSSFTLTFTSTDLSAIPIKTEWKDANGNTLSSVATFDLRSLVSTGTSGTRSGSGGSYSGSTTGSSAASAGGSNAAARGGGGLFGIGGGRGGGLSSFYPVIIGTIVVIAAIVLYVKKKWILAKFRKQ
jgi:archaellum component FlaF (FlaF/FlaG flagellin family)